MLERGSFIEPHYDSFDFSGLKGEYNIHVKSSIYNMQNVRPNVIKDKIMLVYCILGSIKIEAGDYRGTIYEDDLILVNDKEIFAAESPDSNLILITEIDSSLIKKTFLHRRKTVQKDREQLKYMVLAYAYAMHAIELVDDETIKSMGREIADLVIKMYSAGEDVSERTLLSSKGDYKLYKSLGFVGYMDALSYLKCREADLMIFATKKKMYEICETCGFSSEKYFRKCFRKYSGTTPHKRRMFLEENRFKEQQMKKKAKLDVTEQIIRRMGLRHINAILLDMALHACPYILPRPLNEKSPDIE